MLPLQWNFMISKAEIKKLRSLKNRKGREIHKLIIIEGKRLFEEVSNSNFPIHKIVTNLFLHNPILIYLRDTYGINKPIPRALYYGNSALMIPFNFVFGPKPENINANYGPYYYLGSYRKAIKYGGWIGEYQPTNRPRKKD